MRKIIVPENLGKVIIAVGEKSQICQLWQERKSVGLYISHSKHKDNVKCSLYIRYCEVYYMYYLTEFLKIQDFFFTNEKTKT